MSIARGIATSIVGPIAGGREAAITKVGFVIAGQSNSLGVQPFPYDWDVEIDGPNSRILQYSYGTTRPNYTAGSTGDMIQAQDYTQNYWDGDTVNKSVGFWLSALKNYADANPSVQVGCIHAGDSATGFTNGDGGAADIDWSPDVLTGDLSLKDRTLFDNLVIATNLLIAKGYAIGGMLWHQGEYQGYIVRNTVYGPDGVFLKFIREWRDQCFGGELVPVVIGTINGESVDTVDANQVYRQRVEADQLAIEGVCPQVKCADLTYTTDADTSDGTHFSAEALRGLDGKGGIGLVYYNKFAEFSGQPTYSGTPTETTPTLVASPAYSVAGPLTGDGNALTFDGSATQYAHTSISSLGLNFGMCVSGWMRITTDSNQSFLCIGDFDSTSNRIGVQRVTTNTNINTLNAGTYTASNGGIIGLNEWRPFVFQTGTYNGRTYIWCYISDPYLSYCSSYATDATWPAGIDSLIIGRLRGGASSTGSWVGSVAHYAVWHQDDALDAQTRFDLMTATARAQYQAIVSQSGAALYLPMCTAV